MIKIIRFLPVVCMLVCTACTSNTQPSSTPQQQTPAVKPVQEEKSKSCSEIVMEMLTTSERYKALTKGLGEAVEKNGGSSYGVELEGSPHPEQDSALNYSETYDFNLHESYADHNTVVARFVFDKKVGQLYEYDVVQDSLMPIAFDKQLLASLDKACK